MSTIAFNKNEELLNNTEKLIKDDNTKKENIRII